MMALMGKSLPLIWRVLIELLTPGFTLTKTRLLQAFRERTDVWQLAFYLFLSLFLSASQTNEQET